MSDRFENDLERLLAADSGRVSESTRQELAERRRAVLDAAESGQGPGWASVLSSPGRRAWWLPAGAMAVALVVALTIRPGIDSIPAMTDATQTIDMDILLADENLELYDDLDFFQWLAAVDDETG